MYWNNNNHAQNRENFCEYTKQCSNIFINFRWRNATRSSIPLRPSTTWSWTRQAPPGASRKPSARHPSHPRSGSTVYTCWPDLEKNKHADRNYERWERLVADNYCVWSLNMLNPFATGELYMRQLFQCLKWYAGSERVKQEKLKIQTWLRVLQARHTPRRARGHVPQLLKQKRWFLQFLNNNRTSRWCYYHMISIFNQELYDFDERWIERDSTLKKAVQGCRKTFTQKVIIISTFLSTINQSA